MEPHLNRRAESVRPCCYVCFCSGTFFPCNGSNEPVWYSDTFPCNGNKDSGCACFCASSPLHAALDRRPS
jgi:hypothetical protein